MSTPSVVPSEPVEPRSREVIRRARLLEKEIALCDAVRKEATSLADLSARMTAAFPELFRLAKLRGLVEGRRPQLTRVILDVNAPAPARSNEEKYNNPISDKPATQLRMRGRVSFEFDSRVTLPSLFSTTWEFIFPFINLGSGGMRREDGRACGSYSVTLCLDDFPLLFTAYQAFEAQEAAIAMRAQEVEKLAGQRYASTLIGQEAEQALEATRRALEDAQQNYQQALADASVVRQSFREQVAGELPSLPPPQPRPY